MDVTTACVRMRLDNKSKVLTQQLPHYSTDGISVVFSGLICRERSKREIYIEFLIAIQVTLLPPSVKRTIFHSGIKSGLIQIHHAMDTGEATDSMLLHLSILEGILSWSEHDLSVLETQKSCPSSVDAVSDLTYLFNCVTTSNKRLLFVIMTDFNSKFNCSQFRDGFPFQWRHQTPSS